MNCPKNELLEQDLWDGSEANGDSESKNKEGELCQWQ